MFGKIRELIPNLFATMQTENKTTPEQSQNASAVTVQNTDSMLSLAKAVVPNEFRETPKAFIELMKRQYLPQPNGPRDEVQTLAEIIYVRRMEDVTDLSVLKGEAYLFYNRKSGKLNFGAQLPGMRKAAAKHPDFGGLTEKRWCGKDGQWREVWLENIPASAAKVCAYHKGLKREVCEVAILNEVKQGDGIVWGKMPNHMLGIRAEAFLLRAYFLNVPLYTEDEAQEITEAAPLDLPAPKDDVTASLPAGEPVIDVEVETGTATDALLKERESMPVDGVPEPEIQYNDKGEKI
jgi:hypothetical protein